MESPSEFPTTRWTLVCAAGEGSGGEKRSALVSLCETYWYPLYAYVRRRGHSPEESQDLTQEFFLRILEGRYLNRAERDKGRFRAFLLTSLKFYLADQADRGRALKRGGGQLPFELQYGEERYQHEPADFETPESIFERRWALLLLDRVLERLRGEYARAGRLEHFEKLKGALLGPLDRPYAQAAGEIGLSEGALKVAVHRMRKRYRDLFRDEIADTVSDPSEVKAELRYLAKALSSPR